MPNTQTTGKRMRWLRWTLLGVALVLAVAIGLSASSWWMLNQTPDWYAASILPPERRAAAAAAAEEKLTRIHNWAAQMQARESARLHAGQSAVTQPAPGTTVTFAADELNAFFQKWADASNFKDNLERHLADPAVLLRDGHLVLAGTVKDLDMVVSLHFQPQLTRDGQLEFRLDRVLGGRLPLPKGVWESQRERLINAVGGKLPQWRRNAEMDTSGASNSATVAAGMTDMLVNVLRGQPARPVVFVPISTGAIPARLTDVTIGEDDLTLTVAPMSPEERKAYLEQVRNPGDLASTAG